MSDVLYTLVTSGVRMIDQSEGDTTSWVKAEIFLDGESVATGFAPERPPYVEGTARSSAISMAQIRFGLTVLTQDIRNSPTSHFKEVKGAT